MSEKMIEHLPEKNGGQRFERLIAVSDRHLCTRPFLEQVERVCRHRPAAFLLREKDLTEKEYIRLAAEVREICGNYEVPCILHTYVEAARELNSPYIHLSLPVLREYVAGKEYEKEQKAGKKNSRCVFAGSDKDCGGDDRLYIGVSVHSVEEAGEAQKLGADWLIAGHIYATDCKKGLLPRGTVFLREVCESVEIPVYAIGGIRTDGAQLPEILRCGAAGGCVMSGMMRL